MDKSREALIEILKEAKALLAQPANDFSYSYWEGAQDAIAEIDLLITGMEAGVLPPRSEIEVLFAPTGPMQEVSLSSGWAHKFLQIAERMDVALSCAYGSR